LLLAYEIRDPEAVEMTMSTRRRMALTLLGPVVLAPLVVLAFRGREWWRHVCVIIGGGYLIPVLGALAAWRLTAIARKVGHPIAFLARALVGMMVVFALIVLGMVLRSPSLGAAWGRLSDFLLRFETWLALIAAGLVYALPYVLWVRKDKKETRS